MWPVWRFYLELLYSTATHTRTHTGLRSQDSSCAHTAPDMTPQSWHLGSLARRAPRGHVEVQDSLLNTVRGGVGARCVTGIGACSANFLPYCEPCRWRRSVDLASCFETRHSTYDLNVLLLLLLLLSTYLLTYLLLLFNSRADQCDTNLRSLVESEYGDRIV